MLQKMMQVPGVVAVATLLFLTLPVAAQSPNNDRPGYYTEDYTGPGEKGETQQSLAARFRVRVPAQAELWFGDQKTKRQGTVREFITGPLDPNRIYPFRVRARWVEDGITVEKTLRVRAIAGNRVVINFIRPPQPTIPTVARLAPVTPPVIERPPLNWSAPVP
jgi:uncharacterized protein (TIGR03000 family)